MNKSKTRTLSTRTLSLYAQSLKSKNKTPKILQISPLRSKTKTLRSKTKTLRSKTKTLRSKTKTLRSLYAKSIKTPESPGLSPILRKRNAKYVSKVRVDELVNRISFEEGFGSTLLNAVLSNENICIYPKDLSVIVQGYNSYTDYVRLNQATSPEDYNIFASIISKKSFGFYKNYLLKNFEDVWYEDTSKFESECKKDVILFNIDLSFFDIFPGYEIDVMGRHACFLLVDKKKNKAYYIDPMDNKKEEKEDKIGQSVYTRKNMDHYICYKLEAWIYHILGLRMKVEALDVEAPQTITNDFFCTNWSIMIADAIIRYYDTKGSIDPKKVIQLIRKKYNTREKLDTLIRRYISYVKSIEEEHFPLPPPPAPKKKTAWEKIKDYFDWF
jgi:hypothetical protein